MNNKTDIFNEAITLHQAGKISDAIRLYLKVLPFQRDNADFLFTIGTAYCQLGKLEDGLSYLRKSSRINPRNAHVYGNMGTLLSELRRFDEAIINYNKALAINPNFPEVLLGRANALVETKKFEAAISDYESALTLAPNFAIAHCNKGKAQFELGQYQNALDSYDLAIKFAPQLAEAHSNRGHALQELFRLEEAASSYLKAISLNQNCEESRRNLPAVLHASGYQKEAEEFLKETVQTRPTFTEARWMKAMLSLPIIANSSDQVPTHRQRFHEELKELENWFEDEQIEFGEKAVGSGQPYYLAYQEEDNSGLLSRYGKLCSKIMQHWQTKMGCTYEPLPPKNKLRIGIISNHIFQHSVWDALIRGWVEHLDRDRVLLVIFSKFSKKDAATDFASSTKTELVKCDGSLVNWVNAIRSSSIDALIYPEIGMDRITLKLASMRLAPIQIASWGHPETTGLPTVDYYLSADLLEPENSDKYYTEHLVKLPNLGCCIKESKVEPTAFNLEKFGIDKKQPLFVCPGTPFKYQPDHDEIFVDIAKRLGKCQFLFFSYRTIHLTELLKRRISQQFSRSGMEFDDYCTFLPWQPKSSFYSIMKQADVFLDTIGFSGFNTAIQAIECDLPIVTREGKFMRGRLASSILKRIGLNELVAKDEADYVSLAVKLATDTNYRENTRLTISTNRRVLYEDLEPIRALEEFIETTNRALNGSK